ncbi:MAG TPA: hypothetical protein VLB79_08175 [Solirubrobacterales bacterium]|nr:hypothetical protein [Solirubrobacterales bacterium]
MKLWKVQKFAGDVVYDLRQKNLLLPVIGLLIVLVAVPILIARGSSEGSVGPFGFGTTSSQSSPESENAVVAYHPGVRNYKRRLDKLAAKNPFTQQFTSPAASSGSGSSDSLGQALGGSSTSGSTGVGGGSTGGGSTGGGGGGGGKSPGKVTKQKTTYFWWESDVQVGEADTPLTTMNSVKPFQFLPSPDKPVLTYIGTVGGGSQAVFLVSKDVSSIGGEGTCFPSVDACQLLGLNAGKGADLIYGPDGKTYHVQVLRLKRVTSSKPPSY